ncbi:MAG: Aerobic respiration control sensor protein ArcB [Chloroflexota bacterium]
MPEEWATQHDDQFRVTLASIGDAVIVTDATGAVTFMNPVAEALTGWTLAEAHGRLSEEIFQIVSAETHDPVESPVDRVLREGVVVGLANHTLLIARDGAERPIDDSGAPVRDAEGVLRGVVLVFRDVTERKQAEDARAELLARERAARAEAEAAVRIRDQFLSLAAHELRTPLTTLLGNAQLLQRRTRQADTITERDRRSLHVIASQSARLNRMVQTLLDVARLGEGRLTIAHEEVDICALVHRVVEETLPILEGHTLLLDCPQETVVVCGDELRLEHVLQHLLQNAIKYSRSPATIAMAVTSDAEQVCIRVTDHGLGIPQSELAQLFHRFYRSGRPNAQRVGGMGIGLYMVREIVTLHGGTVSVESVEGAGSTFTVLLPVHVAAPARLATT